MSFVSRRRFLAAAGVAALAGCSSRGDSATQSTPSKNETMTSTENSGPDQKTKQQPPVTESVPTAEEQLPLPMSSEDLYGEAQSGGPPKDGIPSIDEPTFVAPEDIDFLDPGDPVFGVARGEDTKAYPQQILAKHEIVNDNLNGTPVSVTYCPLTGTVQGFERGETTFGVSGRLINNNLVMYDRASEAWWPQMLATSIPGDWNEDPAIVSLEEFRLVWTTWKRWQRHHPDTQVLSTDTGHAYNYERDPYGSYNPRGGYYDNNAKLLFPPLNMDDRYGRKTVVMGARTPKGAVAFVKKSLRERGLVEGTIGDTPVLAVHDPALDTAYVYLNPDETTFEHDEDSVVAADGTSHDPDALPLTPVHTFDAMWFAWAGYYPNTNVHE
jgi:hypothetical protein